MVKNTLIIITLLLSFGLDLIGQPPSPPPCVDWTVNPPSPNCRNVGCDNPSAPWINGSKTVKVPGWGDCEFTAYYCYRNCTVNPPAVTVQLNIYYWEVSNTDPGCLAWYNWITSSQSNSNIFRVNLWEEITLELYEEVVAYLDSQNELYKAYCPNNKTEYSAVNASCEAKCVRQFQQGNEITYEEHIIECSRPSCCVYKRQYCVDPQTEEIVISGTTFLEEVLSELGQCDSQMEPNYPYECFQGTNVFFYPCNQECADPE